MVPLGRRNSSNYYDRTTMDEAASFFRSFEDEEEVASIPNSSSSGIASSTSSSSVECMLASALSSSVDKVNRRITDVTLCSSMGGLDFGDEDDDDDEDENDSSGSCFNHHDHDYCSTSQRKFVVWSEHSNTVHMIPHLDDILSSSDADASTDGHNADTTTITRESLWYSPQDLDQTVAECMAAVNTNTIDDDDATINNRRGLEFMTPHGLDISRHSRSIVLRVLEEQAILRANQQDIAEQLAEVCSVSSAHRQRMAHLMGMRDASEAAEHPRRTTRPSSIAANPWAKTPNPWKSSNDTTTSQQQLQAGAEERRRRRSLRASFNSQSSTSRSFVRQRQSCTSIQSNIEQAWRELSMLESLSDDDACMPEPVTPVRSSTRRSSYARRSSASSRRRLSVEIQTTATQLCS